MMTLMTRLRRSSEGTPEKHHRKTEPVTPTPHLFRLLYRIQKSEPPHLPPMSEIRRTEPVEAFDAPSSQPLISLSDILVGVAWVGYHAARLTVKGAVAGSKLACQGGEALARNIRESRTRALTLPEIDRIIDQSNDTGEALRHLASTPAMELPQSDMSRWQGDLSTLNPTDKSGLKSAMHQLVTGRQSRMQSDLTIIAAEVFSELGFQTTSLRPEHGVLVAKNGRQRIFVAVDKRKDGGVALNLDADGFHGGACIRTLDAAQRKFEKRGVHFHVSSRKRKDEHRAIDGRRVGGIDRIRNGE